MRSPREQLILSNYQALSQNDMEHLINSYIADLITKIAHDRDNPSAGCTHKVSYTNGLTRAMELLEEEIY